MTKIALKRDSDYVAETFIFQVDRMGHNQERERHHAFELVDC